MKYVCPMKRFSFSVASPRSWPLSAHMHYHFNCSIFPEHPLDFCKLEKFILHSCILKTKQALFYILFFFSLQCRLPKEQSHTQVN